jgi:hypothetical protein
MDLKWTGRRLKEGIKPNILAILRFYRCSRFSKISSLGTLEEFEGMRLHKEPQRK